MNSAISHQWHFHLPIVALAINKNGDWVAAAMSDGSLRLIPATGNADKPRELLLHQGVSLSLKPDVDSHAFLSGGDDGKVFIIDPLLEAPTIIADHGGAWIDHVSASADGHRAYAFGKKLILLDNEGRIFGEPLLLPSSAGGLEFSPNGKRLAVSHYNGVSLLWVNSKESNFTKLNWKSSHLNLLWHPEGKILITSLQENALHGWRLTDNQEMQMQGYATKVHSMGFTIRGRYLATSGAEQVICWPFFGGGPWGKTPLMLGGNDGRLVKCIAPHPKEEMVAAGYNDGMIILAPLDGRMEIMIHPPQSEKGAAIVGLVWAQNSDNCLFAAREDGALMLFTPESVRRLVSRG